ncbi:MAG: diacylglycerol kinase [Treponema sp.]|jgi:diacylglycerol kinase family enzyme|nr:diacylglycerol kinase [Treponema sp.]
MKAEIFGRFMEAICSRSPAAEGRVLKWTIIVNPAAGGFTIARRWKKNLRTLETYVRKAERNPERKGGPSDASRLFSGLSSGVVATSGPGEGEKIARALAEEAGRTRGKSPPFHLLITAGGDGTSREALAAVYGAAEEARSNMAVLRLPMGTGNDGADAAELDGALEFLVNPVSVKKDRALRLVTSTPGKGPFLAFNILSAGLDAFVTHMTNRMKGKFPGDSYKLWVDIASLLYDRIYRVGPMSISVNGPDNAVTNMEETPLLLAVGASGERTYGSGKRILPDERNVCIVRQMPLLRKLALKGLFTEGKHVSMPETILMNASSVKFTGREKILAQMDGETVLLFPEDFPLAVELTEPLIPVLARG